MLTFKDEKRGSVRAQSELNHESSAHKLNEPKLLLEKARQYCLASTEKVDMHIFRLKLLSFNLKPQTVHFIFFFLMILKMYSSNNLTPKL